MKLKFKYEIVSLQIQNNDFKCKKLEKTGMVTD